MDGIQKTVALNLRDLARRVEEGQYGTNDDFDGASFEIDINDEVLDAAF